jgi:hypothetical protein
VNVKFVLHVLTLLEYVDDRCSDVTSTADDAFVTEAAVSKQEIDSDVVERVLARVGFISVTPEIIHRQRHRFSLDTTYAVQ